MSVRPTVISGTPGKIGHNLLYANGKYESIKTQNPNKICFSTEMDPTLDHLRIAKPTSSCSLWAQCFRRQSYPAASAAQESLEENKYQFIISIIH